MGPHVNLYAAGRQYLSAYQVLGQHTAEGETSQRLVLPMSALLAFAIELFLKAILSQRGWSKKQLSHIDLRHQLGKLYASACAEGLTPVPHIQALISVLDEKHAAHSFRYMGEDDNFDLLKHDLVSGVMDVLHFQVRQMLGFETTDPSKPLATPDASLQNSIENG
ncbi:MAG: hypothetical protein DI552_00325 [Brevundimonas sp.]|nr:MAG: hypothetical protein DI552_00325 [Brevundimonas sp.]